MSAGLCRLGGWLAVVGIALVGCATRGPQRPVPLPPGASPSDIIDRDDPAESLNPLTAEELVRVANTIRESRKPTRMPERKYNILALSGGGVYGAFSSGVLVGWTESGKRPEFDVVTGISAGALVAPFAFLGPEFDCTIREQATMYGTKDVFEYRRTIRSLFSMSIASNLPLRRRVERLISFDTMARIAAEHAKGRRLYVGTTNLDTKRLVVWDMGAIAERMTPGARGLFIDILMASSAIPGFFPPVPITVDIDGRLFQELHVDGGVSSAVFFRPPHVPPSKRESFGTQTLYGSNLYIIVAGKIYPDPEGVRPRTLAVAGASVSNLIYSVTRGDLVRLFTLTMLTGMNYFVAAIPPDFKVTSSGTDFDPVEMTRMFEEGARLAREGKVFSTVPPGGSPGDELRSRTGVRLGIQKADPGQPPQTRGPMPSKQGPIPTIPSGK